MPSLLAIATMTAIAVAGIASFAAKTASTTKPEPTRSAASVPAKSAPSSAAVSE